MIQQNDFSEGSPKTFVEALSTYREYALAEQIFSHFDVKVDYESLWERPAEELRRVLSELDLDPGPADRLIAETRGGKSLPKALSTVFRQGAPSEGRAHLSDNEKELLQGQLDLLQIGPSYSVLFATNHLLGWTGSEIYLQTLIDALVKSNCTATVYARHWDEDWLDRHFDQRIHLTNDLETIQHCAFDLAHVQHNSCVIDVRATFPNLPVLFSSLGVLPFLEQPVPFDVGVSRYLAVSEEVSENLISNGVSADRIDIVRNLVDSSRFAPKSAIRVRPERILVLSYRMDEPRKNQLRAVAAKISASIRFVGGPEHVLTQDELATAINEADIVVSLGRGAVEAMLCGRVPLIFDIHGGDGLITPDNVAQVRRCNFSGRLHQHAYSVDDLVDEIAKYRREYGKSLREVAIREFSVAQNIPSLLRIYRTVVDDGVIECTPRTQSVVNFCFAMAHQDVLQSRRRQDGEIHLTNEIRRIKKTISWRATAPVRVAWNSIRNYWTSNRH